MSDISVVGFVRVLVILDNEGKRLYGKYYNLPSFETKAAQKNLEKELFTKSSKQNSTNKSSEATDIFNYNDYIVIYKPYSDFSIYVIGDQDDNELALAGVVETLHEAFDSVFKGKIERRKITNMMTSVVLIIDELIDNGYNIFYNPARTIISADSSNLLAKLNLRKDELGDVSASPGSATGGAFSQVFAHARNQIAKSLAL